MAINNNNASHSIVLTRCFLHRWCPALLFWLTVIPALAADRVVLQLRWDHQFQFAGYYAAQWQGYYAEADLDVEIRSAIQNDGRILSAVEEVAAGRAQFGIGSADILIARDQGYPLVVLASIFQSSAAAFYALADRPPLTPGSLPNLRVARRVDDLIDVELQAVLRAEGIDPGQVQPYPHQPGVDHLASGQVEVVPGYRISLPFDAEAQGLELQAMLPATYGVDFYGDSIFAHADTVSTSPDQVQRFVAASLKGWRYALEHSDEIARRISTELPRADDRTVEEKRAFNQFQSQGVQELTLYPVVPMGNINPDRWARMHHSLKAMGVVNDDFDLHQVIYNPEWVRQERQRRWLLLLTAGGGTLLLGILLMTGWSLGLRRAVRQAMAQMDVSERRFEQLFAGAPVAILEKDFSAVAEALRHLRATGVEDLAAHLGADPKRLDQLAAKVRILRVNAATMNLFGAHSAQQLFASAGRLLVPELGGLFRRVLLALWQGQSSFHGEAHYLSLDGRSLIVVVSMPIPSTIEDFESIPITLYDITQRKAMENALGDKHELLQVTLQSIGDAVITTDAEGRVQWLNPVAERMTHWSTQTAEGKPLEQLFRLVQGDSQQAVICPVSTCLQQGTVVKLSDHIQLISRTGERFKIQSSASPIRRESGEILGAVLTIHDLTEQHRLAQEIDHQATHDALTGLSNRDEFEVRLRRVLAHSGEHHSLHALLYIDLDQFKLVNDTCGHAVGDLLLQRVSKLLAQSMRPQDTLARLGGDEFGVILEHCSMDQAQGVSQQICDRMEGYRFHHDGRRFRVGTSIGLVLIDQRWSSTAAIMQAADTACYAAKEAGRNRFHTWFESDQVLRHRHGEMQWATRLEHALDEHRFRLYGQRICPLGSVAPSGLHCEVLLRMVDEAGELIAPGRFLPAAERFYLASRIDRWVVREVLAWLARSPSSAIDTLAVNLSGQSIGDQSFHRFLVDALSNAHGDIRRLCFEITETAAITDLADATVLIQQMRALGVRIALDDFGVGVSSFSYLQALPVDYLKIDGKFIQGLMDNPLDRTAVGCFHQVAQVVGLKTVAEFVECEQVLEALREIGIDYAQGYLIHRPEPLDELVAEFTRDDPGNTAA